MHMLLFLCPWYPNHRPRNQRPRQRRRQTKPPDCPDPTQPNLPRRQRFNLHPDRPAETGHDRHAEVLYCH